MWLESFIRRKIYVGMLITSKNERKVNLFYSEIMYIIYVRLMSLYIKV